MDNLWVFCGYSVDRSGFPPTTSLNVFYKFSAQHLADYIQFIKIILAVFMEIAEKYYSTNLFISIQYYLHLSQKTG